MSALAHTSGAMLSRDRSEGNLDLSFEVEAYLVDEVLQSFAAKLGFHLGEHCL